MLGKSENDLSVPAARATATAGWRRLPPATSLALGQGHATPLRLTPGAARRSGASG